MEFDSEVASLQGVFLAHPPDMTQVCKVLMDSQANQRKLFLCIFLNSHEKIFDDFSLEQGMTYGPFMNLFHRTIEVSEFNEIIKRCNLQKFYAECISFFNIPVEFLEATSKVFLEQVDPLSKIAFLAALIRRSRISRSSELIHGSRLAKKILTNIHELTIGEKILSLLYLMKLALTPCLEEVVSQSLDLSSDDLNTYYSCDTQNLHLSTLDRTIFLDELTSQFVTLGKAMDVSMWIDLVDVHTESILKTKIVDFWPHGETPPCNLQLIIAHYSYEVLSLLKVLDYSESVIILKSLANRFERKMNLKLEDVSIKELITKSILASENPDFDWKVELYIKRIATEVNSPNFEAEVWEILESNSKYLTEFSEKFYQMAEQATKDIPARDSFLNLLGSILIQLPPDRLQKILEDQILTKKFSDQLKTSHFAQSLSILLKKARLSDLNSDSELRRKTFWFAIQSPLDFFQLLIEECCEDKSMATLVLEILKMFPSLHQSLSVRHPFENLWSGNVSSDVVQNSTSLLDKLIPYWIESEMYDLLSDLTELILHNVLKSHLEGIKTLPDPQVLSILDILDRVLKPSVNKSSLIRRKLHLVQLIELSGRYDGKGRNQVQSKIKEVLLVLVSCILETDPAMGKVWDDFATETDKLRLETYKGKELCQIDDFLEAILQCFDKDQCLRVSTSNQMDAQRFLGELVAGFSVFLPRDYHLIATRVKVQKHKHGKAIVVPPCGELLRALVVFLSVQASSSPDHLTYVTQSVSWAVMTMLDTLREPDFDELSCLLQMSGVVSTRWPFLGNLDPLVAKVVQTGLGADNLSKSNITFLVAPLSRMEQCETKIFCLNKMKLVVDAMEH